MNRNDEKNVFKTLSTPRVPKHLKPRVLDAAAEAFEAEAGPSRWDLLWDSRRLRATWFVATVGLIVAHVVISLPSSPPPPVGTTARGQLENL